MGFLSNLRRKFSPNLSVAAFSLGFVALVTFLSFIRLDSTAEESLVLSIVYGGSDPEPSGSGISYWASRPDVMVSVSGRGTARLEIGPSPCGRLPSVSVRSLQGAGLQQVGDYSFLIDTRFSEASSNVLLLTSDAEDCTVESDPRNLMFKLELSEFEAKPS